MKEGSSFWGFMLKQMLNVKEFTHQNYRVRTSDVIPTVNGGFIVTGTQGTASANMFAIQFNNQGQFVNKFDYGTGSVSKSIKAPGGLVLAGHISVFQGNVEGKIVKTDSIGNSCCDGTSLVVDIDVPTYPNKLITPRLPFSNFQLPPDIYQSEEFFGTFEFICEDNLASRTENPSDEETALRLTEEAFTEMNVYPNPATDQLTIQLSTSTGLFSLINMSGQMIKQGLLDSKITKIDLSAVDKGLYLLKVEQTNRVLTRRIILE